MKGNRVFHHRRMVLSVILPLLAACGALSAPSVPTAAAATGTAAPEVKPTEAASATATTLPGVQVLPVTSMDASMPWLPLVTGEEPLSAYYGFNFEIPPFNDLLVRKAFAAAVDREQIAVVAEGLGFKRAKPATTLTPPQTLGRDLYGEIGIPFDPDQAAEWLREAGYTDPASFPSFTLLVYMRGGRPGAHYQIAQAVADMWEQHLGVKAIVDALESPAVLPARFQSSPPAIYLFAWGADYNDPDNFLRELLHSTSELNYGRFASAQYDELVDRAAEITDPAERQLLYIEAERILTEEEVGILPLFFTLWYSRL